MLIFVIHLHKDHENRAESVEAPFNGLTRPFPLKLEWQHPINPGGTLSWREAKARLTEPNDEGKQIHEGERNSSTEAKMNELDFVSCSSPSLNHPPAHNKVLLNLDTASSP